MKWITKFTLPIYLHLQEFIAMRHWSCLSHLVSPTSSILGLHWTPLMCPVFALCCRDPAVLDLQNVLQQFTDGMILGWAQNLSSDPRYLQIGQPITSPPFTKQGWVPKHYPCLFTLFSSEQMTGPVLLLSCPQDGSPIPTSSVLASPFHNLTLYLPFLSLPSALLTLFFFCGCGHFTGVSMKFSVLLRVTFLTHYYY